MLAGDSIFDLGWYEFGKRPETQWFRQPDVTDFFQGSLRLFSSDLVCVYQHSESYIESTWLFSEICRPRVAAARLRDAFWVAGENQVRSLYRVGCGRFLTPTIASELKREMSRYRDGMAYYSTDERVAAVRTCQHTAISRQESIYIRKDILAGILARYSCRLMTLIRCDRWSERPLKEWKHKERACLKRRGQNFIYELEFFSDVHRRRLFPSCSWNLGKRDFTDEICAR